MLRFEWDENCMFVVPEPGNGNSPERDDGRGKHVGLLSFLLLLI